VPDPIPSDTASLRAALAAEQQARREAEARASGAEAMVAHLKLLIAKMKRDRFGASAERGRKPAGDDHARQVRRGPGRHGHVRSDGTVPAAG
jgi:hypothetical protein